ncbi:HEAT repeat-containing protein 6 [Geodia barretti]|nr:HEAT repeat-containing protein 6 [Geodia barretti]
MAVEPSVQQDVRRAALHCLTGLCGRKCEFGSEQYWPLDLLSTQLLAAAKNHPDSAYVAKLVLSQLRAIHSILRTTSETSLLPLLPDLLAGLRFFMATGLPGQPSAVTPLPYASIPSSTKMKKSKSPAVSVAEPNLLLQHSQVPRPLAMRSSSAPTSSDSDMSDNEGHDATITKSLAAKLRLQSLLCLTSLFSALSPRNTFCYWQSFLPDGPRLPNSPPSLLSCVLRDTNHKCRSAALAVLCAMLDRSKPLLAAADDRLHHSLGLAFTPFSSHLGAMLREVHHRLLLSLGTETQPTVLTRAARSLALLAANTPYQQLSSGYATRMLSALQCLSQHKDIDVRVACLTSCGAILSISPSLPEVEAWLSGSPWLLLWCTALLQPTSPSPPNPLCTQALQVLAAAARFYFHSIEGNWVTLVELSIYHLTTPQQQQHSLKLLEELTRASSDWAEAGQLWTRLLEGPLTAILQDHRSSPQCAQACAVLATLSSPAMSQLKSSLQALAITLPLGLSRDATAAPSVSSGAVRVLGVYCTFPSLRQDQAFLQDSQLAVLHALASSNQQMRVQASWALANLSDALTVSNFKLSSSFYHEILSGASKALNDKDMVKCNAVRALGNILRVIPEQPEDKVLSLSSHISSCISMGTVKLRWNACYACHSIFSSTPTFSAQYPAAANLLLETLCETVSTCPNFKVCTNASLALTSLPSYTATQMKKVWSATLTSFEHSLQHHDFPEFKQAANLQVQLCRCVCHVLCVESDLGEVPCHPLTDSGLRALAACLHSMHTSTEDRTVLESTSRKLESFAAAVQSHTALTHIYSVLRTLLLT